MMTNDKNVYDMVVRFNEAVNRLVPTIKKVIEWIHRFDHVLPNLKKQYRKNAAKSRYPRYGKRCKGHRASQQRRHNHVEQDKG